MKNIIVLFGGKSCEHDISVITGVLTVNSINAELFNVIPIYITNNGVWYTGNALKDISFYKTKNLKLLTNVTLTVGSDILYSVKKNKLKKISKIDCAVNCCHGKIGEDGNLYGVINASGIGMVGSPCFSSALSMDKEYTKIVLSGLKVDKLQCFTVKKDSFYLDRNLALNNAEENIGFPMIVKPCNLGSSIGIKVVTNKEELTEGLIKAFKYDGKVIIEKYLSEFREINCACYSVGGKVVVSECEEPTVKNQILSFKDKYQSGSVEMGVDKKFPADIPKKVSDKIKNTTKTVYEKCGFSGIIRVDYLLSNDKIYLNEINSIPGSMAYYLFTDTLKGFSNILTELILDAMIVKRAENSLDYTYFSKVLSLDGVKTHK